MTEHRPGSDPEMITRSRRPLDPGEVSAHLAAPLRWRVEQVAVTGSTNADLAGAAQALESGQVRTAEEQLTGRGRSGRDWSCPAGAGLMFSCLLRLPQVPADRRGWTGAVLGLAIVGALQDAFGSDARGRVSLKWPNDVLIDGRKCAGILGEAVEDAVVVGAGINVSIGADELPRADATSLLLVAGAAAGPTVPVPVPVPAPESVMRPTGTAGEMPAAGATDLGLPAWLDRARLFAGILDHFGNLLDRWVAADGNVDASGVRGQYRTHCSTLGARVRLILPGGAELITRAVDVGADGALLTEDDAGRRASYSAADVVHLRAAG